MKMVILSMPAAHVDAGLYILAAQRRFRKTSGVFITLTRLTSEKNSESLSRMRGET